MVCSGGLGMEGEGDDRLAEMYGTPKAMIPPRSAHAPKLSPSQWKFWPFKWKTNKGPNKKQPLLVHKAKPI